jgi:TatD DNase family protein
MFIDSHAHIDGPEFDQDRDEVLQRARSAGVSALLNVGTGDPHSGAFERAVRLSEQHEDVYTAVGVHPHDARLYDEAVEERIQRLLEVPKIVAWGEIGLDFHYDNSPRDVQMEVFRRQLRAARAAQLPVIVHTREAEKETIEILNAEWSGSGFSGVMHCFSGSLRLAQQAIELGFLISFSGIVTFKKAHDLRVVAREVQLDRLLIETDCPFLAPIPFRGKRNEPAYVIEVAKCLAELRTKSVEEIGTITTENFFRTFKLKQHNSASRIKSPAA